MGNPIYDDDIRTVERESPALQWAIKYNYIYNINNPEGQPPTDDEEKAYRLLSLVQFKYKKGDCVMIRGEDNRRRWHHVKIVQSYGWWLFGEFVPIYVISFGDRQVQICQEKELWSLSELLTWGKPVAKKSFNLPGKKRSKRTKTVHRLQQWLGSDSSNITLTDSFSGCFCAAGQCVHYEKYLSEEGEIVNEDDVF